MIKSFLHECLYFSVSHSCVLFRCLVSTFNCLPCVVIGFQMSVSSLLYNGFSNGASYSTQNLTSAPWEIYAPIDQLISLHGVFLGRATNNIMEYNALIELLTDVV
jgi:hypothetical protein